MATEDKNKRVAQSEIDDQVKKLTITGQDELDQVVKEQEIGEDDLEMVTGGENYDEIQVYYDDNIPDPTDSPNHRFLTQR